MVTFDADEYLHLALHASRAGQPHAAMTYLKQALEQRPEHAPARYLLAIQHAELGLRQRAIAGMEAALAMDPQLHTARLQLGLLLLDVQRPADARRNFALLVAGNCGEPLQSYAQALVAAIDERPDEARALLEAALALPSSNTALTALMQGLLDDLSKRDVGATTDVTARVADLGAYRQAAL